MDGVSVETAQGSCSELRERKGRGIRQRKDFFFFFFFFASVGEKLEENKVDKFSCGSVT